MFQLNFSRPGKSFVWRKCSRCVKQLSIYTQLNTKLNPHLDDKLKNAKSYEEMPTLTYSWKSAVGIFHSLPIIGKYNLEPEYSFDVYMDSYRKYGKIYKVQMTKKRSYVCVLDVEEIRKAYQYDDRYPQRKMLGIFKTYRKNKNYPSGGILTENGEAWANVRFKVQTPMLRTEMIEKYIPKLLSVSSDFVERMRFLRQDSGEIPDFRSELYKWAVESVGLVTYNTRLGCLDLNLPMDSEALKFIDAINGLNHMSSDVVIKFWKIWPNLIKNYRKFVKYHDFMIEVSMKYIGQTKERLLEKEYNKDDLGVLETILQQDIDPKEIAIFLVDIFIAGIDTTSHSFGALLYLLAQNPEKQEKLYKEIEQTLQKNSLISRKCLDEMHYLRGCIKESLRMMAVAVGTHRYYNKDIVLGGYIIPAGTRVLLLTQIASKLDENFKNPLQFEPERWLPGAVKPHPFSNIPFGFGVRACIGKRIAFQEMEILLLQFMQKFKVEYHYDDIRMKTTRIIAIPDKPLKLKFVDR